MTTTDHFLIDSSNIDICELALQHLQEDRQVLYGKIRSHPLKIRFASRRFVLASRSGVDQLIRDLDAAIKQYRENDMNE